MRYTIKLLISTVVVTLVSATTVSATPTFTVIGGAKCKQVLKFCARSELECLTITGWSAGFISGFNWTYMTENLSEIVEMKLPKGTMDIAIPFGILKNNLIKHCDSHPSQNQAEATLEIMFNFYRDNQ